MIDISTRISSRSPAIWRNLTLLRGQMWGFLPHTDELFDWFENSIKPHVGDAKQILEFGHCMGYSASMQLETFPNATIHTYDPVAWSTWSDLWRQPDPEELQKKIPRVAWCDLGRLYYGDRYQFYKRSSVYAVSDHDVGVFDYAFIDGEHKYDGAKTDLLSCLQLEIPYILIDNMEGKDVQQVVSEHPHLELLEEIEYTQHYPVKDFVTKSILHLYKSNYEHFLS